MRLGPRRPSMKKRLAARTSWKRYVRHSLGFKAPRGMGWLTNPRKAAYNRVYNRTTFSPFRSSARSPRGSGMAGKAIVVVICLYVLSRLFR
jgi:hypothetical protein